MLGRFGYCDGQYRTESRGTCESKKKKKACRIGKKKTYPQLEVRDFLLSHSVGFGNDWYQVDFSMESAHELDIDLLQTNDDQSNPQNTNIQRTNSRVTRWLDEI